MMLQRRLLADQLRMGLELWAVIHGRDRRWAVWQITGCRPIAGHQRLWPYHQRLQCAHRPVCGEPGDLEGLGACGGRSAS